MFVGARIGGRHSRGPQVQLRRSEHLDLRRLAAQRSTEEREPVSTGALWECPHCSSSTAVRSSSCRSGTTTCCTTARTRSGGTPTASSTPRPGDAQLRTGYFAPSFYRDAAGRPSLTFWLRGARSGPRLVRRPQRPHRRPGRRPVGRHPHPARVRPRDAAVSGASDGSRRSPATGVADDFTLLLGLKAEVFRPRCHGHRRLRAPPRTSTDWSMPTTAAPIRLIVDGPPGRGVDAAVACRRSGDRCDSGSGSSLAPDRSGTMGSLL